MSGSGPPAPAGTKPPYERPELARVLDVTDSANPTEVTCGGYSNRYSAFRRESCVFTASEGGAYRITVHGNISRSRQDYSTGPYELTVTAR